MTKALLIIPLLMMAYDAICHFLFACHDFAWWRENSPFRWWIQFEGELSKVDMHYNLFWGVYYLIACVMLVIGLLKTNP